MSDKVASFWRPERGSTDQQYRYVPPAPLHGQGRTLTLSQNEVLYSLIGTYYGGDGRSNFAVPKMPSPLCAQGRWCIALVGNYPQRP